MKNILQTNIKSFFMINNEQHPYQAIKTIVPAALVSLATGYTYR
jgi:hypothetical protein